MQRHEGIGELLGSRIPQIFKSGAQRVTGQYGKGWVLKGLECKTKEHCRGAGVTQAERQNGVQKDEFSSSALFTKTSQEQEYCWALQLTSWVLRGHPPNLPGC